MKTSGGDVMAVPSKRFYGPSMKQSGALAAMMNGSNNGPARGAKTLGWFMNDSDLLFEKKNNKSTAQATTTTTTQSSSDEEKRIVGGNIINNNKQKRLRKTMSCQGAARKEGYAASQAMSESSEEGYDEKRLQTILNDITISKQSGSKNSTTPNDEYWFYDVASDGYYYEQNGAKGWRRRMPNGYNKKDQEPKMSNGQIYAAQAAQAAILHHAILQQQQQQQAQQQAAAAQQQQPTMRYYDPNSDGFFYEMASVDGWKRRQPNKPLSASVPAGITRPYAMRQATEQHVSQNSGPSYGAALARGQMPRNYVIDESSASSSICGDNVLQDLLGDLTITRPNKLNESMQINPNFNADRFIRDLSFSGLATNNKLFGVASPIKTPSNNQWASSGHPLGPISRPNNHACSSLWNPSPIKSTAAMEDEISMLRSLKDLDKIWAAPTPLV